MDIELPYGSKMGVESSTDNEPFDEDKSNRELARIFLEMFDPIGDATVVAFRSDEQANKARKIWGTQTYKGKVQSMSAKSEKKMERNAGFARKMEMAMADGSNNKIFVPKGTEVFISVAPSSKELEAIEGSNLGEDCLCILLNARLDAGKSDKMKGRFEGVFHLRAVSKSSEDFLYRSFPKDWTLARKPKIGPPKVIKVFEGRPDEDSIKEAIGSFSGGGIFGDLF